MAEVEPGQDPVGEDPRIASLEERIERAEQIEKIRTGERDEKADENTRLGNRVLAELIGGLLVARWLAGSLTAFLARNPGSCWSSSFWG